MIRENQKVLNRVYLLCDILIIIISFVYAWLIKFEVFPPEHTMWWPLVQYMKFLIYLIPIYLVIYSFSGVYTPMRQIRLRFEMWNFFKANTIAILTFPVLLYVLKESDISRSFITIFYGVNVFFGWTFRFFLRKLLHAARRKGLNQKHMLIVGYSSAAESYIDRLISNPQWGYTIFGILDDDKQEGSKYRNIKVLGAISDLEKICASHTLDEIAITLRLRDYHKLEHIVAVCEKSGVHTQFVPDYNNVIPTTAHTEDIDGLPVINIRNVPLSNSFNKFIKRVVDIFGAVCMLIVFGIPMLIVSILVKLTSPGPLIFKQVRVGLHNKEFNMYKFRSMKIQDAGAEKKAWTTKNDPRVTPIGSFIRKTSIDELPQVFNVLKGDMSLVGPRPERPFFVEKFQEEIPRYNVKHQVRPGITGWAQVNGFRGDTSIRKRIDCDLYYIENWTLGLDFKILFLTFFKGFINKNAY